MFDGANDQRHSKISGKPSLNDGNPKAEKQSCSIRLRVTIGCLITLMLAAIVVTTAVLVVRSRQQNTTTNTSSTTVSTNGQLNRTGRISIQGLINRQTVMSLNVCESNETVEDCVLVYNAKIVMKALVMLPNAPVNDALVLSSSNDNTINKEFDCRKLKIRRSQLFEIFEAQTLKEIFHLSGVSYSSADEFIETHALSRPETRSQVDARSARSRWTTPINYFISTTTRMTPTMINTIRLAISLWQNNTCLTFNELSTITQDTNRTYILFTRDDQYGCSSPVGYDRTDPTSMILLASGCGDVVATVMHEIGHTLGYIHTHSRIDRNSFVTIMSANIGQEHAANFFMWSFGTLRFPDVNLPYDFGSFMHYSSFAFSRNSQPTIVPLDNRYERTMGQREAASFYDYKAINRVYCFRTDCPEMFNTNRCLNNGYLDPRTCNRCICPDGFGGTNCDQRDPSATCGETIINLVPSTSGQITIGNPMPTSIATQRQYCVFHIRSQTDGKIRMRLDSINTTRRTVCSLNSMIEVKYQRDLAITGARWCGDSVPTSWLNITAQSNTMVIIFRANNFFNPTTRTSVSGFRATIFFDPEIIFQFTLPPSTSLSSATATTTSITTTTSTYTSTCPEPSFRCRFASQPTCGGCLNFRPCQSEGFQQCTMNTTLIRLTGCDQVVNGFTQCQYSLVQVPVVSNCQRTVLLCCPNYRLIYFHGQYFCIFDPQATDRPTEWSLVL